MKSRTILVFGGSGFLGSHVADALSGAGYHVKIYDRKESKWIQANQEMIIGDLLDQDLINKHIKNCYAVYNFAAIKHVRSEKDIYSLMQMFDTNVLKHSKIIDFLIKNDLTQRYFSVSTDKTANPVSLMGASKKLMELDLI